MNNDKYFDCYACGNPECEEGDEYCFNCGAYLKNYCTNDHCSMNDGDRIELPGNHCYCPSCGEETFFMQKGYCKQEVFKPEQNA